MTNIFQTPEKHRLKRRLFEIAVTALEDAGWSVERIQGSGKSSVRRIRNGPQSKVLSIRTSQDTWIAFPRNDADDGWETLDDVDAVVAVSVDDPETPRFANVHMFEGDVVRAHFNRAYAARRAADYQFTPGRGMWVSLYLTETDHPVTHIGAGLGLKFPPIASVPLDADLAASEPANEEPRTEKQGQSLTIAEAKRRLAASLGVEEARIRIIVDA